MKKLVLLFLLISGICKAQEELIVQEMDRTFSIGNKNAFVIDIPQAQLKKVQSNWKTYLKHQSRRPASSKDGEVVLPYGTIPTVSADSITVFSIVSSEGTKIKLSVAVMMQDSSFLSTTTNSERSAAITHFIRQFGIQEYKNAVNDELLEQQNKLKSLEKIVSSLENENEGLRKDIKNNERTISRKKDEINMNEQEQTMKNTSIIQQKTLLNNYVGSEEQKTKEIKLLKQLTKEKEKLQDNKESMLKKIDDLESENRSFDKQIEKNNEEKIPEAKKQVSLQKAFVESVQTKMSNIK
ncbi:MAG: hypothetical protein ACO1G9_10340 [Bacteroidota bacterium]